MSSTYEKVKSGRPRAWSPASALWGAWLYAPAAASSPALARAACKRLGKRAAVALTETSESGSPALVPVVVL